MHRLARSNVLLYGLGGVGVEIGTYMLRYVDIFVRQLGFVVKIEDDEKKSRSG